MERAGLRAKLQTVRPQRVLPSESREAIEVGVGRDHGAAVLDCDRRVLSICDQLAGGPGLAAQPFENVKVIWTGTYDSRLWPLKE